MTIRKPLRTLIAGGAAVALAFTLLAETVPAQWYGSSPGDFGTGVNFGGYGIGYGAGYRYGAYGTDYYSGYRPNRGMYGGYGDYGFRGSPGYGGAYFSGPAYSHGTAYRGGHYGRPAYSTYYGGPSYGYAPRSYGYGVRSHGFGGGFGHGPDCDYDDDFDLDD